MRLRNLEEEQESEESETNIREMDALLGGTMVQSKGENASVMFEGPEQRRTFMKVCHGLVNQIFKEKWKNFVAQEVNAQMKSAMKTVVKDICATRTEDARMERIHENAEERVEQLRNEIEKMYKISHDLDEEIAKLHEVKKTKAKQVSHLISQIKALENHQLAHANDIKIVHEESNHLRDRMDSLEEKTSVNNNLANYLAITRRVKKNQRRCNFKSKWAICVQVLHEGQSRLLILIKKKEWRTIWRARHLRGRCSITRPRILQFGEKRWPPRPSKVRSSKNRSNS